MLHLRGADSDLVYVASQQASIPMFARVAAAPMARPSVRGYV